MFKIKVFFFDITIAIHLITYHLPITKLNYRGVYRTWLHQNVL